MRAPSVTFGFTLLLSCLVGQGALSQAVSVMAAEEGQGYLFREDGICYLMTAAHVTDGSNRAQVLTQDGREGVATMMRPFWLGFDLDIGQVRRLPVESCSAGFADLARGAASRLAGVRVTLPLVGPGGIDNLQMSVTSSDYLEFSARFDELELVGKKGMSGGFATLEGIPVGMARTTTQDGAIRFIQMAEITMNLRRWLDRSVVSLGPATEDAPSIEQVGLAYEVISAFPPAIDGDHVIEAMVEGSGPFVYPPGQDAVIVLRNLSEGQKVISRLRIESEPKEGYSLPRQFRVDLIPQEGYAHSQFWQAGTFPPDGQFDTGPLARRFAEQIRITLIGAWNENPVRIDRIRLD